MTQFILLLVGFGAGILAGRSMWKKDAHLGAANEAVQARKEGEKVRVMGLFAGQAEITNDDVQKLLGVSDATATNYLSELESDGKLTQIGGFGHTVRYRRNG